MENNTYDLDVTAATADSRVPLPGAVLAAARVARGMSEEDIARRLKLSVAQVKAIETGDHSRLPSEVFVRGFIRSYARLLNVDIAPLLPRKEVAPPEIANERMMKQAPGVSMEPSRYRRLPVMAASAALVLSGLVYYEFVINAPSVSYPATSMTPAQTSIVDATAPTSAALASATAASDVARAAPPPTSAPVSLAIADNLTLKKSSDPASGVNENGLHFLFNAESWVEVRDGVGKVVFSKINAPGSERIVRGDPPFSVVIGSASGVQLSYNGSHVDLASHATEGVARLRLE